MGCHAHLQERPMKKREPEREILRVSISPGEQKVLIEQALLAGYSSVSRFVETILNQEMINLLRASELRHASDPQRLREIRERIARLEEILAEAKANRQRPLP
jgi:hypothetical protein